VERYIRADKRWVCRGTKSTRTQRRFAVDEGCSHRCGRKLARDPQVVAPRSRRDISELGPLIRRSDPPNPSGELKSEQHLAALWRSPTSQPPGQMENQAKSPSNNPPQISATAEPQNQTKIKTHTTHESVWHDTGRLVPDPSPTQRSHHASTCIRQTRKRAGSENEPHLTSSSPGPDRTVKSQLTVEASKIRAGPVTEQQKTGITTRKSSLPQDSRTRRLPARATKKDVQTGQE